MRRNQRGGDAATTTACGDGSKSARAEEGMALRNTWVEYVAITASAVRIARALPGGSRAQENHLGEYVDKLTLGRGLRREH